MHDHNAPCDCFDKTTFVAICAETHMAAFGLESISLPDAAWLLGYNIKTVHRMVEGDNPVLATTGNVQKKVRLADVERLRGSPLTVAEWLRRMSSDGKEPERCAPPSGPQAAMEAHWEAVRANGGRHGDG